MSTPASLPPTPAAAAPQQVEVTSHTGLVYWWPVWAVGFLLAALTYWEGDHLAVVPAGTTVKPADKAGTFELTAKETSRSLDEAVKRSENKQEAFPVPISHRKGYGIIFLVVQLLVIFGSNIPMRGVASLLGVMVLVVVAVLFSVMDWWSPILEFLGGLHVQMSVAAYLLPAVVLFVMWVVTVFFTDRLESIIFTPGQVTVLQDVGTKRQVYDAVMVHVEKRPNDLLRHWILGFGAGDLVITIPSQDVRYEFPNVLFVEQKLARIQALLALQPIDPTKN